MAWVEETPANRKEFKTAFMIFSGLAVYAAKPNAMPTAAPQRRRIWRQVVRYSLRSAAAVILMIGAAYTGKTLYRNALSQQNMSIVVPAGQQMSLTLPDNSQVQLNSGTRLEYPVVFGKTRSVKLSGEALFDVAPDRKHPFIVQTFASDIRVLGTKFNVLADAERGEFTTTLIEGQVQVTNRANSNERITMYPHDVVSLSNAKLRRWMRNCMPLMEELMAGDFHPKMKMFSAREVRLIVRYLGEPDGYVFMHEHADVK